MSSKPARARHDAAALPRIRDLASAGLSLREIADQLDADGLPPPRRGSRWSPTAVKRILDRADQAPPNSPQATVRVDGAVNMTGPLTIFASGPVNTTGPVNITTHEAAAAAAAAAEEQPEDSSIILARPSLPFPLSRPRRRGMVYELALSPADPLGLSNPLFIRRRV